MLLHHYAILRKCGGEGRQKSDEPGDLPRSVDSVLSEEKQKGFVDFPSRPIGTRSFHLFLFLFKAESDWFHYSIWHDTIALGIFFWGLRGTGHCCTGAGGSLCTGFGSLCPGAKGGKL